MNRLPFSFLLSALLLVASVAQSPQRQKRAQDDLTVRIGTKLVQIDVAVTDKNDQVVRDLKFDNFELYEDGKKQQLQFIEFVDAQTGRRSKDSRDPQSLPAEAPTIISPTGASYRRVFAFVVDDLTIPANEMVTVRQTLSNFVDKQMAEGDLVAIVRSVGGRGLLEQFTADRDLLRRAISTLTPTSHPFSQFNNPAAERLAAVQTPASDATLAPNTDLNAGGADIESATDDTNQTMRSLMAISTSNYVVESLKQLPGRKSMVLISGGLPLFDTRGGTITGNVSTFFSQLADNAARAGVVINTMDIRGLQSLPGVASFTDTPGRGSLDMRGAGEGRFGQNIDPSIQFNKPTDPMSGHLGLRTLADLTGGQSILYTNNFESWLEKILKRGAGYYLLAYTPENEIFDGKFRKIQVKVKRDAAKIYTREGYFAKEDPAEVALKTKEEEILRAARSPVAKSEIPLSANVLFKLEAANKAALDIHLLIDPKSLVYTQAGENRQNSFDVVGFVFDQYGKNRGGFSETVNANLSPDNYKRVMSAGLSYTASTKLPPGAYQLRIAVRENSTGKLGTLSRYIEIPDLNNRRLAMSSVFLYAADPDSKSEPAPMLASRELSRKQDLRYAAIVYNAKLDKGKPQLRSQLIVSQGDKVLYKEPEQPIEAPNPSQIVKLGQLALAKVKPGRYTMTLVITDGLADKKIQTVARKAEFVVID
jgi:VWFA-related protein